METCSERRKRKLIALAAEKGGTATIATDCGLNPASLDQIVKGVLLPKKADGTRAERSLGDDAARTIETRYGLERGWFDSDDLKEVMSERDQVAQALEVITKALMNVDDFTRDLVRHSLSRLGKDPAESGNISHKIADLLVKAPTPSGAPHDRPRSVGKLIGGSALQDIGGKGHGRGDRTAAQGGGRKG